jgi:hypothetical protein
MPRIERELYHQAVRKILDKVRYQYRTIGIGKILINKDRRKLYINVAGKNLPYFDRHGKEAFPWETYIQPERLSRIEREADKYDAESWIAFCYAILKDEYKNNFNTIVNLNGIDFGVKLIKTTEFRKYMKPRSPSWSVVDLPRDKVTLITCDIETI